MGVRENKVETYLSEEVAKLGGTTRKWVSPGRDGVTDQIVIYRGEVFFVEVKTVDGVLSSAQNREHIRLRFHGANVSTVYGKVGVSKWIQKTMLKRMLQGKTF